MPLDANHSSPPALLDASYEVLRLGLAHDRSPAIARALLVLRLRFAREPRGATAGTLSCGGMDPLNLHAAGAGADGGILSSLAVQLDGARRHPVLRRLLTPDPRHRHLPLLPSRALPAELLLAGRCEQCERSGRLAFERCSLALQHDPPTPPLEVQLAWRSDVGSPNAPWCGAPGSWAAPRQSRGDGRASGSSPPNASAAAPATHPLPPRAHSPGGAEVGEAEGGAAAFAGGGGGDGGGGSGGGGGEHKEKPPQL